MTKFVVVYRGGSMPESPAEQEAGMAKWMAWFGELGSSVLDVGNPFAGGAGIDQEKRVGAAASGLTGYSILEAQSLADACELAKGCPIFDAGGALEIHEAVAM